MATKTKSKKAASKAKVIKAPKPAPETQPEVKGGDQLTKLWWTLKPEKEDTGAAMWHHFVSECGRYQLSRIDSQTRDRVVWAACYLKGKAWDTMFSTDVPQHAPLFYKTASEALKVIEGYHCDRMKVHMDKVETNRDDLMLTAAELPAPVHQGKDSTPKIGRGKKAKDKPVKQDATESNQTKDGQPEKPAKQPKAKDGPGRDRFNCKLGSQAAQINATINGTAKTPTDMIKETGLDGSRVKSHIKFLLAHGHIKAEGNGYVSSK